MEFGSIAISQITPIFVVGSARTGTTWTCNLLSTSPHIVSAQHHLHWGLHESKLYYHQRFWGGFNNLDDYIRFVALYSSSDYFQLVNGDREWCWIRKPKDFYDFYFELMDRYARSEDALYWLTKISPQYLYDHSARGELLARLEERYSTIRWIVTHRDFEEVLNSHLHMEGRSRYGRTDGVRRELEIIVESARMAVHYEGVVSLTTGYPTAHVDFEALQQAPISTIAKALSDIDVESSGITEDTGYKPNSSFLYKDPGSIQRVSGVEMVVAKTIRRMLASLPGVSHMATWFVKLRNRLLYGGNRLPPRMIYHRLIKADWFQEEFRRELNVCHDRGLLQVLDEMSGEQS